MYARYERRILTVVPYRAGMYILYERGVRPCESSYLRQRVLENQLHLLEPSSHACIAAESRDVIRNNHAETLKSPYIAWYYIMFA